MNVFIDTKRLEKLRKRFLVLDVVAAIAAIISYIASGYNVRMLLVHVLFQDITIYEGTRHFCIFLLFVSLGIILIVSVQLIVLQAIIKMIDNAYKCSNLKGTEIEKK